MNLFHNRRREDREAMISAQEEIDDDKDYREDESLFTDKRMGSGEGREERTKSYNDLKKWRATPSKNKLNISKDLVMSNFRGKGSPTVAEINERLDIEQMIRSTFLKREQVTVVNENEEPILDVNGNKQFEEQVVFDEENFGFLADFFGQGTLARSVTSRATGDMREGVLNEMYGTTIKKEVIRKKTPDPGIFGSGRA